jgi:ABC-type nitrate/sulfonate/bicarbonate transport system substrate-binding protein
MRYFVRADSPVKTWADLKDYNYFTEDFIAAYPKEVQTFVNGIARAQAWIDDPANWEEAARLTGESIGADVAYTHYFSNSTAIIDADIQYWIDGWCAVATSKRAS